MCKGNIFWITYEKPVKWCWEPTLIQLHRVSKLNKFGILSLKFIVGINYIDTWRDVGCILTSHNINHTNWWDYILDKVYKMSDIRSFVANMYY